MLNEDQTSSCEIQLRIEVLIISSVILIPSIILHGSGLYFLHCIGETTTNQKLLLINMSVAEFLCALMTLVLRFLSYDFNICNIKTKETIYKIIHGCSWLFYYIYLMAPILVVLDRLIGVATPLSYRDYFSKKRAKLCVALTWVGGVVFAAPLLSIPHDSWLNYCPFVAAGIEILVIIIFVCAYSWIGCEVRNRRRPQNNRTVRCNRRNGEGGSVQHNFKLLTMASLIIVTFIIFVAVPEIIIVTLVKTDPFLANDIRQDIYCITTFNLLIDPIIYLFGFPPLRKIMKEKMCLRRRTESSNSHELPPLNSSTDQIH